MALTSPCLSYKREPAFSWCSYVLPLLGFKRKHLTLDSILQQLEHKHVSPSRVSQANSTVATSNAWKLRRLPTRFCVLWLHSKLHQSNLHQILYHGHDRTWFDCWQKHFGTSKLWNVTRCRKHSCWRICVFQPCTSKWKGFTSVSAR